MHFDEDLLDFTLIMDLEGGEVRLRYPAVYADNPKFAAHPRKDTAELFRPVGTDDFEPLPYGEASRRNRAGIWNWMYILVNDVLPLEEIAKIALGVRINDRDKPLELDRSAPAPYGLRELAKIRDYPDRDVFMELGPDRKVLTVISCSEDEPPSVPFPGCSIYFRASDMDVKLTFRRTELYRWQELTSKVETFLACATTEF